MVWVVIGTLKLKVVRKDLWRAEHNLVEVLLDLAARLLLVDEVLKVVELRLLLLLVEHNSRFVAGLALGVHPRTDILEVLIDGINE